MSRVKAAKKTAKELIDKANLATGLKVTDPGYATKRRVMKRGRNVNVAAGAGTVAAGAGASSLFKDGKKQSKPLKRERSAQEKETKSQAAARIKKNMQDYEKQQKSKKKFNVGVSKGGVPFKEAFKHFRDKGNKTFTWNGKKYTTELASAKKTPSAKTSGTKSTTQKKKVGGLRKFLLGEDGKFGGARGAIDFLPGKSRPKRKAGGGMMKAKGMAKGGKMMKKGYAMGGAAMKKKGYKKGGAAGKFPDLTGDGKVTQKDILRGRGVPGIKKGGAMTKKGMAKGGAMKKKGYAKGGMTKKGYAKGGMTKKGYAKGGAAMKSKGASKGGVRRGKPRGVGAALRGYGKALR